MLSVVAVLRGFYVTVLSLCNDHGKTFNILSLDISVILSHHHLRLIPRSQTSSLLKINNIFTLTRFILYDSQIPFVQ
jgi:hypothetical protein